MELNEMEAMHESQPPVDIAGAEWVGAEGLDPDEQILVDIQEAISLFITVKALLDYVGSPILCKVVSKRERDTMAKVSEQIREFLASAEPTYLEEG